MTSSSHKKAWLHERASVTHNILALNPPGTIVLLPLETFEQVEERARWVFGDAYKDYLNRFIINDVWDRQLIGVKQFTGYREKLNGSTYFTARDYLKHRTGQHQ